MKTIDDVKSFLTLSEYYLKNNTPIFLQNTRKSEKKKDIRKTNLYTFGKLFPNEKPPIALRRELLTLTPRNFIETVEDSVKSYKKEFWVFGKEYNGEDVYIKYRLERPDDYGTDSFFVMSFHFAIEPFKDSDFPYNF